MDSATPCTGYSNTPVQPYLQGILLVSTHFLSLIYITRKNAETWPVGQKGTRRELQRYCVLWGLVKISALEPELGKQNTCAETGKHCTVQWPSKQLFNSPLPAFPDKQSQTLLFCRKGSHCLVYGLRGQGCWGWKSEGQGRWHQDYLSLIEAFQVSCAQTQGHCVKTDFCVAPTQPWEF